MAGGTRGRATTPSESGGDDIERLINKVCTNFTNQLETKFNQRFDKLDSKLLDMSNTLNSLKTNTETNSKDICHLRVQIDQMNQISKKNSLRFNGLPETDDENTIDVLVTFINNKLSLSCTKADIDCAFRVGQPNQEKPRTLLGVFTQGWRRSEIFNNKKILRNSGYSIFEDLTKPRYDALMAAKKKFGNLNVWSSGGKVYLWNQQDRKKSLLNMDNELK